MGKSLLETCKELDLKEKIESMSPAELKKNLYDALRVIKLVEEVGEISEGFLTLVGYKKSSKPKEKILQNLKEEFIDADIMINVLEARFGIDDVEKGHLVDKKVGKWRNKYVKPEKQTHIAIVDKKVKKKNGK